MPPTDVTASTIAMLNDTCGNLISSPNCTLLTLRETLIKLQSCSFLPS